MSLANRSPVLSVISNRQESFWRIASIHDRGSGNKDPTAIERDIISQESAAQFELARMCSGRGLL